MTTGNSSQPASQGTSKGQEALSHNPITLTLDYKFYERACALAGETATEATFTQGQTEGKFKFTEDATLLNSLLALYNLNLHLIAGEWTAFTSKQGQVTVFGETPLEAVLTWVIEQPLDLLTG